MVNSIGNNDEDDDGCSTRVTVADEIRSTLGVSSDFGLSGGSVCSV